MDERKKDKIIILLLICLVIVLLLIMVYLFLIRKDPEPATTTDNTTTTTNGGEGNYEDGYYGKVNLVGSFDSWSTTDYALEFIGNGNYTITFTPKATSNGSIQFKFNRDGKWDEIDWGYNKNTDELSLNGGENFKVDNVTTSSVITIRINTLSLEVEITIQ